MTRMCSIVPIRLALAFVLGVLLVAAAAEARTVEGPDSLAGITLGQTVESQAERLVPSQAEKAFGRPFLGIMPVAPLKGYRSGYVDYGLCAANGRVVRIKMNYADDSLAFFTRILEALKKRYGEPREWRGNAFGTLRTWKWSLKSKSGSAVSLILMHYSGEDGAFTEGNSIRIAATDLVRAEEVCYAATKDGQKGDGKAEGEAGIDALGYDWFLPQ